MGFIRIVIQTDIKKDWRYIKRNRYIYINKWKWRSIDHYENRENKSNIDDKL